MVSRKRVGLLARKAWWSRENVLVCSRGRAGGLASTCLYAREEGLVVSRVCVRETTSLSSRAHERRVWDAGNARTRYLCSISL